MNPIHVAFGSSTNIDLHADRLTSRTFDLLKTHWIWPNLYDLHTLDPLNPRFLSTFLRFVDLGSFIDSKGLADHMNRTSLVQRFRPAIFMRRERDGYVIVELLEFLRAGEYYSISAGVASIKCVSNQSRISLPNATSFSHVIDRKIPIELTLLCRFLELVIGSFVMASTYNKTRSLHGVTLPRSWILENVRKPHKVQNKDARFDLVWTTALLFRDLLENVYAGYGAGE
jgi:hypothetical protein